jgi:hypothetical protein
VAADTLCGRYREQARSHTCWQTTAGFQGNAGIAR